MTNQTTLLIAFTAVVAHSQVAFITNGRDGAVSVLDLRTEQITVTVQTGGRPRGLQVSPDGRSVYIAAIDARTHRATGSHSVGLDPEQFGLSPDGRTLYAVSEESGTMSVLDLKTGKMRSTHIVGIEPEGVGVSPDGRWVYVTSESSKTVAVYDTRKNHVAANFLVDARPRVAIFSADGKRAWISAEVGGTLSGIDTSTHTVKRKLELPRGSKPVGLAVSPDGRRLYVANGRANSVLVVDTAALRLEKTIPVGQRPWGIALSPDGLRAYAVNGLSNTGSIIDTRTHEVVRKVPTGNGPWGIAIAPAVTASLLQRNDDSARHARARIAGRSSGHIVGVAMNHQAGASQVEKAMMAPARDGDPTQSRFHFAGAILSHHKVRQISRMSPLFTRVMRLAGRIEMPTGRLEIGRIAPRPLVNVKPVLARCQTGHFHPYSDGIALLLEPCDTGSPAVRVPEFGFRFCSACSPASGACNHYDRDQPIRIHSVRGCGAAAIVTRHHNTKEHTC